MTRAAETSRRPARSRSSPPRSHEPAEAAFHHPAAFEDNKAFLGGIAFDDAAAHAVEIAPVLAKFGEKSAVQHRFAQARPGLFAGRQRVKRVPVLDVGGHDRYGEPDTLGVNQGHALAPEHLLGGVVRRADHAPGCTRPTGCR